MEIKRFEALNATYLKCLVCDVEDINSNLKHRIHIFNQIKCEFNLQLRLHLNGQQQLGIIIKYFRMFVRTFSKVDIRLFAHIRIAFKLSRVEYQPV